MPGRKRYDWEKVVGAVRELMLTAPDFTSLANAISSRFPGMTRQTLGDGLRRELKLESYPTLDSLKLALGTGNGKSALAEAILSFLLKERQETFSLRDLSERFDRAPSSVQIAAEELREAGYNILVTDDMTVSIPTTIAPTSWTIPVVDYLDDNTYRFGFISDTHLCNRHSRLDVQNALYDRFVAEGIRLVLHGGNLIDGESNLNRHELLVTGIEGQIMYAAANYPKREGIETWFCTGACHEGWWSKAGFDVGRYMASSFKEEGREDLKWIGHIEADLPLGDDAGILRVQHPGGGSAYAISYNPQKIIESLQGGEKPCILLLGHFHKYGAFYPRNVFVLMMGTGSSQTVWMRGRPLEAHVGGGIIEIRLTRMGGLAEVKHTWWPYYDAGFYKQWDIRNSWKSHLGVDHGPEEIDMDLALM